MSNDAEQHGGGGHTEDPQTGNCQPCDLGSVEGIACKAQRYQKQSEVMVQAATDLDGYKKQYDEARKAFGDAWEATAAEITAVRAQLDEIYQVLKCRLTPEQKECLDEAAEKEFEVIDECAPPAGCCVGNCEFDDAVGEDDDAASLTARIEAYRRDTAANTTCFLSLVGEAQARADQVAKIKAEVTSLAADSAGGDATKVPRWYARWLIADHQLQLSRLGHGFTTAVAYGDCLCKALQCIAKGWDAIAVLEGARAELACLEAAAKTECERRTASVLVTILDAYECCMEGVEESPPGKGEETGPEQSGPEQTGPEQTGPEQSGGKTSA
jgi:hypothetical protein